MLRALSIAEWLALHSPIVDVRSPGEFKRGHVPGAQNLPLFTDEERTIVGTLYKRVGRDAALLEGLRLVGPKLALLVEDAQRIAPNGRIRVYCWRGGERSGSVGWLLDKAGFAEVHTLQRGYKAFRTHVRTAFDGPFLLNVLGGFTGTGKTEALHRLATLGQQIIDLEALACHRGSSFGALGEGPQPTTEHFENLLWDVLRRLDVQRPIWVEDESAMIGRISIPKPFFERMRTATLYFAEVPLEQRVARLVNEYGHFSSEHLAEAIRRIAKRIGPQHCKAALAALSESDLHQVVRIMLRYYDKSYLHGTSQRAPERVFRFAVLDGDQKDLAMQLFALP